MSTTFQPIHFDVGVRTQCTIFLRGPVQIEAKNEKRKLSENHYMRLDISSDAALDHNDLNSLNMISIILENKPVSWQKDGVYTQDFFGTINAFMSLNSEDFESFLQCTIKAEYINVVVFIDKYVERENSIEAMCRDWKLAPIFRGE